GLWRNPPSQSPALLLAGSGRAGGIRAFRPDLAGSGSDHARAHGGSRRRQTGSPPRPRSPARRNPRAPARRIPPENHRLVTDPPQAVRSTTSHVGTCLRPVQGEPLGEALFRMAAFRHVDLISSF